MPAIHHDYLPAVDGLRAVAVLAVIINHMLGLPLPSGYLGVDIFFVISGYVISLSLLARQQMPFGRLMLEFYARRVKRLLPALFIVVIVGALTIRLFDPGPVRSIVAGALALVGASNLFFFGEAVDYFGGNAALNIFTHTWSLGVEEQFYLVYPVLFVLAARGSTTLRIALMGALSLASLIAYIVVLRINQPAAYFLMPFRFWELGLGCLVALVGASQPRVFVRLARFPPSAPFATALIGLALPQSWQVAATLLTVVSATLLLATLSVKSLPGRLLASSPIVYVGRISYSLYLWHWLILCLSVWTIGIHWWTVPFQLAAIFLASAASYHLVEVPFRYRRWIRNDWHALAAAGVLVSLGITTLGVSHQSRWPSFSGSKVAEAQKAPEPGYVASFSGRRVDDCRPSWLYDDKANVLADLGRCRAGNAEQLLVFMGDSHAMDLLPMADRIAASGAASVLNIAQDGCRAPALRGEAAHCRYQQALIGQFASEGDKVIFVLRNNYNPRRIDFSLESFMSDLTDLVDRASAAGIRTVYIAPAPKYTAIGPLSLCSEQWFRPRWAIAGYCTGELDESRSEQLGRRRDFIRALQKLDLERDEFLVFDPFDLLCGSDRSRCSPLRQGRPIYRDESHLTEEGSEMLAEPFVSELEAHGFLHAR